MLVDVYHVSLATAIVPRPLSIETGEQDVLWPAADAIRAGQRVADLYGVVGAEGSFTHRTFAGDHHWDGTGLVDDLRRWLATD